MCIYKIYVYMIYDIYKTYKHIYYVYVYTHTYLLIYKPKIIMTNDIITFPFGLYSVDLRETSFILSYVLLKYCIEKCGF